MSKKGGIAIGPSHKQGGIHFNVAGEHIEIEGREIAICSKAYHSPIVHHGYNDYPYNILMAIQLYYGCNTGKITELHPGEWIICKRVVDLPRKVEVKGTVKEIINHLQSLGGCKVDYNGCDGTCDHSKKEDGGKLPTADYSGLPTEDLRLPTSYPFFTHCSLNQLNSILQGNPILTDPEFNFFSAVYQHIQIGEKFNRPQLQKLAASYGLDKFRSLKELTELAYVALYRSITMDTDKDSKQKFAECVEIYNRQQNMNFGDQDTLRLQQYSTPAPIAYLLGEFCLSNYHSRRVGSRSDHDRENYTALEPSAGNGLLTVALDPKNTWVNELDPLRNKSLQLQGFAAITNQDATKPLVISTVDKVIRPAGSGEIYNFDIILSNPPFGGGISKQFGNFTLEALEHVMIAEALQQLKDTGSAAFIIGGHTKYDAKGRIAGRDKAFLQYLIKSYQLTDVINVDGSLYRKQGTTVPIRLLLIQGRRDSDLNFPLYTEELDVYQKFSPKIIYNFTQLEQRILH